MSDQHEHRPADPGATPHRSDVRVHHEVLPKSLILRTLLATLMVGVALCFLTYVIMRARVLTLRPSYQFPEKSLPPPHQVANVRQELFQVAHPRPNMRTQQTKQLESFEWVDRRQGLVRVPIDVAIDLLIARRASAAGGPGGRR